MKYCGTFYVQALQENTRLELYLLPHTSCKQHLNLILVEVGLSQINHVMS